MGDCDTTDFLFVSFMGLDSRWQFTVIMKAIYIRVYICISLTYLFSYVKCLHCYFTVSPPIFQLYTSISVS